MTTTAASTVISRHERILSSDLDEGVVLMDIEQGLYFALEQSAARLWRCLDKPSTVQAVCDRLVDEYDVSADQCLAEVVAFVEHLCALGVLHAAPANAVSEPL